MTTATATATSIRTVPVTEDLYRHYRQCSKPQPAQLTLDLRTGTLTAQIDPTIGGGIPMDEGHGLVQTWRIPALSAEAANALLREIEPVMQRILSSAEIYLHPETYNAYGRITNETAERLLDHALDHVQSDIEVWDAADWLDQAESEVRDAIRAGTTIDQLEAEYSDPALITQAGATVLIIEGLREHLETIAAEVAAEAE